MTITTMAEARAEQRRRRVEDAAVEKWKRSVNEMGLTSTALRAGIRIISRSPKPGNAVNGLIKEYRGRKSRPAETVPMATVADVRKLVKQLGQRRGMAAWFPSDPQSMLLKRVTQAVVDAAVAGEMTAAEFQKRARVIRRIARPYPKHLLEDEVQGMGRFNERNPVATVMPCPEHMNREMAQPYAPSAGAWSTPKPFTTTPEEQESLRLPPFLDRKLTGGTPEGIEREWQKWKLLHPKPQEN